MLVIILVAAVESTTFILVIDGIIIRSASINSSLVNIIAVDSSNGTCFDNLACSVVNNNIDVIIIHDFAVIVIDTLLSGSVIIIDTV